MFDAYKDLADSLERQLLERPEPPSHVDARTRLQEAKLPVGRVINVYPDCVLYVDPDGVAMTAWAHKRVGSTAITYFAEVGFQIEPHPYIGDTPE